MLQDYCNHFPKSPKHSKPQVTVMERSKNRVELPIVWIMDQKVPGEQSLKQLERPSVIPFCIHLRQHGGYKHPQQ